MTDHCQPPAGKDFAVQALRAARAAAKQQPAVPKKRARRAPAAARPSGRDPQALAGILGRLTTEAGWTDALDGGSVLDQWTALCPEYDGLVQAVAYDDEQRILTLRPSSPAYAVKLRLTHAQLAQDINAQTRRETVRAIRVLPPGRITAADTPAPAPAPEPQAPEPRKEAPAGYRAAKAALANRPALHHDPDIAAAVARQEAALRAHRPPLEEEEDDAVQEQPVDSCEAARRRALARKYADATGTASAAQTDLRPAA
ncbi:DciA family protein [Streptomyces chilikensis]|uniref:DciA family protein n=1 Tax=Streptomyces chilikensis TaxID=1194079 RepID=A0ABV3ERG1_9ACTN